jgi:inorganic pyrophosphatase
MNIDNSDINKLLELRKSLVLEFESYKDYKSNKNAIMKEWDHVASLERTIKKLDDFLSKFVKFS